MKIAESYGLETEKDLQEHLINSIQVRMGTTTCSEDVANALKLVLANTPSSFIGVSPRLLPAAASVLLLG